MHACKGDSAPTQEGGTIAPACIPILPGLGALLGRLTGLLLLPCALEASFQPYFAKIASKSSCGTSPPGFAPLLLSALNRTARRPAAGHTGATDRAAGLSRLRTMRAQPGARA